MTTDETTLIARLLANDEAAFSALIDRHHGSLLRLAQTFVSSRGVAEEVVQDTWLAVLEGLPRFEGRSSLKSWIFRILCNQAKTRGVREHRSVPFSAFGAEGDDQFAAVDEGRFTAGGHWQQPPQRWDDHTPERLLVNQRAMQHLQGALDALPPGQRAVVVLRDVEGVPSEEVCNILELSETNQRVLLHRARATLRTVLEPHVEGR
ncbi:MAG: sigma-70 family RNA polymerase sigma factor [Myxococcales bacterium]|nr:sigma-70 family RNA polymerase sigma factor [Myxococcales bacterium]